MKKILPIIIALLLAAVASIGIVQATKKLTTTGAPKPVVIATQLLPKGKTITRQDLDEATIRYPQYTSDEASMWKFVLDDFVAPNLIDTAVGKMTTQEIKQGQPILASMLVLPREERIIVDWKTRIDQDKRAISIPITAQQAVAGLVTVGDFVDILVTLPAPLTKPEEDTEMISVPIPMGQGQTQTVQMPISRSEGKPTTYYLLQSVEILAVGTQTLRNEQMVDPMDPFAAFTQDAGMGDGVTVAVSPEQALLFAYAISSGDSSFVMTLRNPRDKVVVDPKQVTPGNFEQLLKEVGAK